MLERQVKKTDIAIVMHRNIKYAIFVFKFIMLLTFFTIFEHCFFFKKNIHFIRRLNISIYIYTLAT